MSGRAVLLTGATGFLGSAVARTLRAAGEACICVDSRPGSGLARVDITDDVSLGDHLAVALEDHRLDSVMHLAAAGAGDRGLAAGAELDTARAVRTNVEGFVRVVETAARWGARRVVWSSSTTVYGPSRAYPEQPVREDVPLWPATSYGATKAACEFLGPVLAARNGIEVVSLRLPMIYGPSRWYGGSQRDLMRFVAALRDRTAVAIDAWQDEADWIHVGDAARALVALVSAHSPRPAYHVVGHRGSLSELCRALRTLAGSPSNAGIQPLDSGAPDLPAIDDHQVRRDIGFAPRFGDAKSAAASLLEHHDGPGHTDPPQPDHGQTSTTGSDR